MSNQSGHTFAELVLVLLLLGILLGLAAPPLTRWRDRVTVAAARDEISGALALTRTIATAAGGAALVIDPADRTLRITTSRRDSLHFLDLRQRYGVALDVGSEDPVEVRYDALGIGRLANRTIAVRRAAAKAHVTVSAYGRVRRW